MKITYLHQHADTLQGFLASVEASRLHFVLVHIHIELRSSTQNSWCGEPQDHENKERQRFPFPWDDVCRCLSCCHRAKTILDLSTEYCLGFIYTIQYIILLYTTVILEENSRIVSTFGGIFTIQFIVNLSQYKYLRRRHVPKALDDIVC